ncbi:MAG: cysteine--tRNA ligase [Gammaproteobacteria bacterium]|jgi:cysteinyl-tRNA synthetase|nr:cysteine--tRNA ligase [Gammaproteobacteria bacterium]
MSIQLYNTLTGRKEVFVPGDPERITMYVCGPTVYSFPHIGNARPPVVFDLLYRVLSRRYPTVIYARNITDLDDKINAAAKQADLPIDAITTKFAAVFHDDMAALGVPLPTIEPRATEHISQMIAMIESLIEKGHAYEADGHVLFHVPSFPEYGRLSRQDREKIIEGARVEVAPYKRDAADFVLWKPSTMDLPGWDSPWGRGRPGWHLECACMIEEHLGDTIDIHGGGSDLVFPHHENEIAQGTCAHDGQIFSRYWMHVGFVNVDKEKMSKSLGNVLLIRDLLEEAPGEAIRLALLSAHYRSPVDWSTDTLDQAARTLDRLYGALRDLQDVEVGEPCDDDLPEEFVAALEDDLDTRQALAVLFELRRAARRADSVDDRATIKKKLVACAGMLGIGQQDPNDWLLERFGQVEDVEEIERLVAERDEARHTRDFAKADRIRDALVERGIVLEDGASGTRWRAGADPAALDEEEQDG